VRALGRRHDRSRPVVLASSDLMLDPAAKRPGGRRLLTPGSEIIEAVWDFAYDSGFRIVDQYINYLRR
jgi:hypothetical protein